MQLFRPTSDNVQRFLAQAAQAEFSYPHAGATRGELPAGYVVDRTQVRLGSGQAMMQAARRALSEWKHFELGWLRAAEPRPSLAPGAVVAVQAHIGGFWWLNACRIVYLIDEANELGERFGFAYGTLPTHAEQGEERFQVVWNRAEDSVHYEILAFSRPRHLLARLFYPWTRRVQRQFGRDSTAAMVRATAARAG
jgi:uncharacterized protein (UPF0548 family)